MRRKGVLTMEQPVVINREQDEAKKFEQWCFKQTVEIEHKKQKLEDEKKQIAAEKRELEEARRSIEYDRRALIRMQEQDKARMKQEQHLFDMKWKILEEELLKLAEEKKQIQRQKEFYSRVHAYESGGGSTRSYTSTGVVKGELFFIGVSDENSLKKRYKDLIKIYHPDNLSGDTGTIQEINKEYDKLKKKLG